MPLDCAHGYFPASTRLGAGLLPVSTEPWVCLVSVASSFCSECTVFSCA